jgi:decaprenylphospho-beta-D-erythro-pentofuranosid-2-ulose 2-reductase
MSGQAVLIVGPTSSIARALAKQMAIAGDRLYLAGRDLPEVQRIARDLQIRYRTVVGTGDFDANDVASHPALIREAIANLEGLDCAILAVGELGDQAEAEASFEEARRIIQSNYTGVVSLLMQIATHMERQRRGTIVAIASVAGDRGRRSNYVYGSAKGALALYLQGLRARLFHAGVHVLTVKPGFVDTKMTFGRPGMFLMASPQTIARGILAAIRGRREVVYLPAFWSPIMAVIRLVPEPIFKRLRL